MRTHLEFRSDAFPGCPEEETQVNAGRHGRRLAEFLREALPKYGVATEEIYAEDWGWAIPIVNPEFSIWVGCGNYEEYPNGYLCFIEPTKPTIRRWLFKVVDTTTVVERVASALEAALQGRSDVEDLRWWSENESGV